MAPTRLTMLGAITTGVLFLAMFNSAALPAVLVLFALTGVSWVPYAVSLHTQLQGSVVDRYRGRVLGAFETMSALMLLGGAGLVMLNDPAALLSPQALERLKAGFAQFGEQGQALLAQVLDAIRAALAVAIHDVYLAGTAMMILATVLCLFLREIPLRRAARAGREGAGSAHESLVSAE